MKYELFEDAKEIMEKVSEVDLDALIEKMGEVKIDAKSRNISLVYYIMHPDGDTIYELELKPQEDGVKLYAKQTYYETFEYDEDEEDEELTDWSYEDEGEYVTDQMHKYFGGEKWLNLYKLLIKEMNTLKEIDEDSDEYYLMLNSNEYDNRVISTTALAIFKEFVDGAGEEESDDVFFELGYRSVYEMITAYIYNVVEITEE